MRVPTFAFLSLRTRSVRPQGLARDPAGNEPRNRLGGRRGFSLVEVAVATAVSAVLFSAIYTVIRTPDGGDRALRTRVELHLDAVRVLREVTEALKDADLVEADSGGASPKVTFRRAGSDDTFAIVLVPGIAGRELQLRRLDASGAVVTQRVLGRHLERVSFETAASDPNPVVLSQPAPGRYQLRVTAWFRRVVDKQEYTASQAGIANLRSGGK